MGGNVSNECETDEIPPLSTNGWGKLGYKVQSIVNTTPYLHYMLGSIREGKYLGMDEIMIIEIKDSSSGAAYNALITF